MYKCKTNKGTIVYLCFINDCCENEGGYWVEVYLNPYDDRYDDFCIHKEDCDCSNFDEVLKCAKEYMLTINNY